MKIQKNELSYIKWQNRAFRFYIGARTLYLQQVYAPAAYCANISLELALKASCVFYDRSFTPEKVGHSFPKLLRILHNKGPEGLTVSIPRYFFNDSVYLTVTRYPSEAPGVGIPVSFLDDLDAAFTDIVVLVPFQFNSELVNTLRPNKGRRQLQLLRRKNKRMRLLRRKLKSWI